MIKLNEKLVVLPLALSALPVNQVDTIAVDGSIVYDGDPVVFPDLHRDMSETNSTWKDFGSLGVAPDYAVYGTSGAWTLFALGAVLFTSTNAVATPDLVTVWTPVALASETGLDLTRTTVAGTTGTLGQLAIVAHSDGTKTEWGCVKTALMTWEPRTSGIVKHANGDWYRQTIAADSTAEYTLLSN